MAIISLIAAVDEQGGLGKAGQLLCHLPADLKHFKALTRGKPIIMGRKTFESIGKILPERLNIILSRTTLVPIADALVLPSLEAALHYTATVSEVMIIGGAMVYADALPYAEHLYLTRIHHQFDADVFFPPVDWQVWQLLSQTTHPADAANAYAWSFELYSRRLA